MKVAVTGARELIGRHLTKFLAERGHIVVPIDRDNWNLMSQTSPRAPLDGCDGVVHLAARIHVRGQPSDAQLFESSVRGTELLARAAADQCISRFVYRSSAAVFAQVGGRATDEASSLRPETRYGQSKLAAEEALRSIAVETGLAAVALRPPLVYGSGAPGNFARLVRIVLRGLPVPSGALVARRSFLSVTNLCDLVACARKRTAAAVHSAWRLNGRS